MMNRARVNHKQNGQRMHPKMLALECFDYEYILMAKHCKANIFGEIFAHCFWLPLVRFIIKVYTKIFFILNFFKVIMLAMFPGTVACLVLGQRVSRRPLNPLLGEGEGDDRSITSDETSSDSERLVQELLD